METGRFDENAEIEPYPNGTFVNRETIQDITPWPWPLPREQK